MNSTTKQLCKFGSKCTKPSGKGAGQCPYAHEIVQTTPKIGKVSGKGSGKGKGTGKGMGKGAGKGTVKDNKLSYGSILTNDGEMIDLTLEQLTTILDGCCLYMNRSEVMFAVSENPSKDVLAIISRNLGQLCSSYKSLECCCSPEGQAHGERELIANACEVSYGYHPDDVITYAQEVSSTAIAGVSGSDFARMLGKNQ